MAMASPSSPDDAVSISWPAPAKIRRELRRTMSSSSMNSSLVAMSLSPPPPLPRRQLDDELRPRPDLALDVDLAAVALDGAVGHGQPQPGALATVLGREEGLEDLAQVFFADADSRVADGDHGHAAR